MDSIKIRNMTSVYFVREDSILCLYRIGSRVADRLYVGAAGGHFENEEMDTPEACVLREMKEELSLEPDNIYDLRLRYITHRLKNGELRQNYYYFAGLKEEKILHSTEGILRWIPLAEFPELPMPVSAKHMILHYLEKGRLDNTLYAGITEEGGTNFISMEEF